MQLTALGQPSDFSTLSRQKTEREGKGGIVHSTTAQGYYCYKISKGSCDYGDIFTMTSERLYSGTGDTKDSANLTGNAIKVELVLFMSLKFISLHKRVEKSTSVDCFLQQE